MNYLERTPNLIPAQTSESFVMTNPPARVGDSISEIDTPALIIDLEAYERNLDRMAARLQNSPIRLRAHAKTHKSPIIAQHQIQRGAVGVCCQKVSEAEALVNGGVRDVLVSNQIVGKTKLIRLAALAKWAKIAVCVDDAANVRDLNEAARAFNVRLPVLVEVDVGASRCGIPPGDPAVELAQLVERQENLHFAGVQAYHGAAQHIYDANKRRQAIETSTALTRQTIELIRKAGLKCDWITGAGTGTYEFEIASGIYTEIQAGSYIFMDVDYRRVKGACEQFEPALFVFTTIMSRPTSTRAVCDAGLKAHSVDSGLPQFHNRQDIEYVGASDEHGTLKLKDESKSPQLEDKLMLIPGHCDPTVNLYDWYVCIRNGVVESLWPIAARGAVT
jgi:3-hydroxy-D-aspartate aldolase